MTRRLHPCRTCKPEDGGKFMKRGFTRHKNRICSHCRRNGPPLPPNYLKGRAA